MAPGSLPGGSTFSLARWDRDLWSALTSLRLVSGRLARLVDEIRAEFVLGRQSVVCTAAKREIGQRVLSPHRVGLQMVELEVVGFSAALPRVVEVSATALIALEDGAPNRCGDTSSAPARVLRASAAGGLLDLRWSRGDVVRCARLLSRTR